MAIGPAACSTRVNQINVTLNVEPLNLFSTFAFFRGFGG